MKRRWRCRGNIWILATTPLKRTTLNVPNRPCHFFLSKCDAFVSSSWLRSKGKWTHSSTGASVQTKLIGPHSERLSRAYRMTNTRKIKAPDMATSRILVSPTTIAAVEGYASVMAHGYNDPSDTKRPWGACSRLDAVPPEFVLNWIRLAVAENEMRTDRTKHKIQLWDGDKRSQFLPYKVIFLLQSWFLKLKSTNHLLHGYLFHTIFKGT